MSHQKINPRTAVLLVMILAVGAVRVIFNFNHDISSLANFSPLGAMAIFGGAYFNRNWKAFGFPLLTLFVSDFILHQTVFKSYGNGFLYEGWYWVYGAIALICVAGTWIMRKPSTAKFLITTFVCVMIHWTLTDIGVWWGSKIYSQDLAGYFNCLVAAIPFEFKFLAGTLVYGTILFGAFEWMKIRNRSLELGAWKF
jgi:hypothetical protein